MVYAYDPRDVLIHFNPNHDKLGRFATSGFGSKRMSKSVDKADVTDYNKDSSIDKEKFKKYVKIGAGILAASLITAGGVYLVKSGKLDNLINSGKRIVDNQLSEFGSVPFKNIADTGDIKRLSKPETIAECMQNTNPHDGDPRYDGNCTSCSIAAFMRMYGFDVKAGKVIGNKQSLLSMATRCYDFDDSTNTIRDKALEFGSSPEKASKILVDKFGKNAAGAIGLNFQIPGGTTLGHAFNFVIKDGNVQFFDTQKPKLNLNNTAIRELYWPMIAKDKPFEAVRLDNATPIFDFLSLELET